MFEYIGAQPEAVLEAAATAHRALIVRECEIVQLAADWADCHPVESESNRVGRRRSAPRLLGGDGTPAVVWGCVAELATVLETSTGAAEGLMADALDLRHRLPRLWRLVVDAGVRAWKVRKVAQATRHLAVEAANAVDAVLAPVITSVAWTRCERLLEAAVMAADPADAEARAQAWEAERFVRAGRSVAGLKTLVARARAGDVIWFMAMVNRLAEILAVEGDTDPIDVRRSTAIGILANPARALQLLADHVSDVSEQGSTDDEEGTDDAHRSVAVEPPVISPQRLQPTVVLHVHLAGESVATGQGVARFEEAGPVTVDQIRRFLGRTDCRIRVQPVLDPTGVLAVDRYEAPAVMRDAMLTRNPADVFPWGVCTSRSMDLDHTIPYLAPDRGGPPGQTSMRNLGPLTRSHHRLKTFFGWRLRQPEPGQYLWRSPHGWVYLVNPSGTHDLGHGELARAVWEAVRTRVPDRAAAA